MVITNTDDVCCNRLVLMINVLIRYALPVLWMTCHFPIEDSPRAHGAASAVSLQCRLRLNMAEHPVQDDSGCQG